MGVTKACQNFNPPKPSFILKSLCKFHDYCSADFSSIIVYVFLTEKIYPKYFYYLMKCGPS